MNNISNISIFSIFFNNLGDNTNNNIDNCHNNKLEIIIKTKKIWNTIISKIRTNKKLKNEVLNLYIKIIQIYISKNNLLKNFNYKEIIASILFLIMKEKLGIKIGFIFELDIDLNFEDLNEVLNFFYINLRNK